jgi:hypothetical protein
MIALARISQFESSRRITFASNFRRLNAPEIAENKN